MHAPTGELQRHRRALKQLRIIDVICVLVKLIDRAVCHVFDVVRLDMSDRYDKTWVVEEIPLGEVSPPSRIVKKNLHGIIGEVLTVGNRVGMKLMPLMVRVLHRSVCQSMLN